MAAPWHRDRSCDPLIIKKGDPMEIQDPKIKNSKLVKLSLDVGSVASVTFHFHYWSFINNRNN